MVFSKTNSRKKAGESSGAGKFTNDLETISKALYMDQMLPRLASSTASSRSKSVGKSHSPNPKTKQKDAKNKDSSDKETKPSIWSWKGLRALTNIRNRRFNCCFSLLVHSVEGLPPIFDDVCLVVHWKRRNGEQMTRPVRVYQGVAEIEEQLTHSCSIYGTRSGSAKYEAKHFLLYASFYNAPELDLGKHRVDMTRLLPLTLEELGDEKSSGKWTTSFRLSGKARGATMNVSFGYVVIGNSSNKSVPESPRLRQDSEKIVKLMGQFDLKDELSIIHRVESFPARLSTLNQPSENIKDLHEVLPVSGPELSDSVNVIYQKLGKNMFNASVENKLDVDNFPSHVDSHKLDSFTPPDAGEKITETEWQFSEFSVVEKGIEEFTKEHVKLEENISEVGRASEEVLETDGAVEVPVIKDAAINPSPEEVETVCQKDKKSISTCSSKEKENDICSKESLMKELETALSYATDLANEGLDSQEDESDAFHREREDFLYNINSCYGDQRRAKSLSLDDVTDLVANDFLDMLGIERSPSGLSSESEPESPRERLLKQFEKDALANGGLLDIENDPADIVWEAISNNLHQSSTHEVFQEMTELDTSASRIKTKASRLEDLESEALMRDWGLNEDAFQHSPPSNSGGFGSPVGIPPNEVHRPPPLAEGLGPFVRTKNGGFLRSMIPALFMNAKNGGSLIMQVSSPVVVPAGMGSGVMDILQGLAALGIEKLSMQANRLMPLEDITGRTIQQIAWEAGPSLEGPERQGLLQPEFEMLQKTLREQKSVKSISSGPVSSDSTLFGTGTEYVSLDDLAPLAMDKIEALSIEGLRIQSGMSYEDAPSNISAQSIGEFSALKGKTLDAGGSIGLDGSGGLQLLDIKDNGEDVDGLMGLSLTLDEWMRFDSGEIDDDDLVSERTSKILAAHRATSLNAFRRRTNGEKRRGKGRKYGLLGNNFTVALMVQLRDPLRNYEPVGTPMLSLIQVERIFVPPTTKIYGTACPVGNIDEEEDGTETGGKECVVEEPKEDEIIHEEEMVPGYKITEVHVAGLKMESGRKKLWGSTNQQKSGSRWLLANGMGKKNKHPLMKSKPVVKNCGLPVTTTAQPGDTLWSISCRVYGTGDRWKDLEALNPHVRNSNVIFANETIRLR